MNKAALCAFALRGITKDFDISLVRFKSKWDEVQVIFHKDITPSEKERILNIVRDVLASANDLSTQVTLYVRDSE